MSKGLSFNIRAAIAAQGSPVALTVDIEPMPKGQLIAVVRDICVVLDIGDKAVVDRVTKALVAHLVSVGTGSSLSYAVKLAVDGSSYDLRGIEAVLRGKEHAFVMAFVVQTRFSSISAEFEADHGLGVTLMQGSRVQRPRVLPADVGLSALPYPEDA